MIVHLSSGLSRFSRPFRVFRAPNGRRAERLKSLLRQIAHREDFMTLYAGFAFFFIVAAGCLLFLAAFYFFLTRVLTGSSGLPRLAALYPAGEQPAGQTFQAQNIKLGPVRWRFSTTVVIASEGLYLKIGQAFARHPPLLIPWEQLRPQGETLLYWGRAMRFAIGEPAITTLVTPWHLYEAMRDRPRG